MNCEQFVQLLTDYLDGNLPEERVAELQAQMQRCRDSLHYYEGFNVTVHLAKKVCEQECDELPDELAQSILRQRKSTD